ncbi:SUKH-4 family immunity protein [Kitasatospora sp. NPDC054768]
MATHAELTKLFSPQGVITLPREEAVRNKLPQADIDALADVGLPAHLDAFFSINVTGEPSAFTLVPIDTGDAVVNVLCLGGPPAATDGRFCLDLEDGYIILLQLGEQPAAEIVNTSLAQFTEFLYRIGLRYEHIHGRTDDEADDYTRKLRDYLAARDPQAFAAEDTWWSMVFDHLLGKDLQA